MKERLIWIMVAAVLIFSVAVAGCTDNSEYSDDKSSESGITITDSFGRLVTIPSCTNEVVCSSGGGCVRYLVYMDASDAIVGVDSGDQPSALYLDTRSYTLANPQFDYLSLTGSFSLAGSTNSASNLEQIMTINPQVIFMLGSLVENESTSSAADADNIQSRTGIPVIAIASGSYTTADGREQMYDSYRIIGKALGKESRAEELINYIEATIADLSNRTKDIPEDEQKSAYIGGVSYGGGQGLMSTKPEYPPFLWVNVKNIADSYNFDSDSLQISKEALLYADPEYVFIDAGTLYLQDDVNALEEIKKPLYSSMYAVQNGNVYSVLPYNYRGSNLDTILADAYYVGKIVYPERFEDIDPNEKADEIYAMFVGEPVFDKINDNCNNLGFKNLIV